MFGTSKPVPKTEKPCCVFKDNRFICANKTIRLRIGVDQDCYLVGRHKKLGQYLTNGHLCCIFGFGHKDMIQTI